MRIVLVEDSPADVPWFTLTMAETGIPHKIEVFETDIDAVQAFRQTVPPDFILTKWRLAVLEIDDFIRLVRLLPGYATTPIGLVTSDSAFLREKALALGAICCLEKPVDVRQLEAVFGQLALAAHV
jgi:CheY-like chemotaxis protein